MRSTTPPGQRETGATSKARAPACEVEGRCSFAFTSAAGRTGPVVVSLPPGYANAELAQVRYPVVYVLHGYEQRIGQLEAAMSAVTARMNAPLASEATRLPRAIVVYVDGRCRPNATGEAECYRGTFFADSPRASGAHQEAWWLELMTSVEQSYRTLESADVTWEP
jgi:hypothetical protein